MAGGGLWIFSCGVWGVGFWVELCFGLCFDLSLAWADLVLVFYYPVLGLSCLRFVLSWACLVLSCLVLSCLGFVLSCLVLSCLVLSCLVLSCLVLSRLVSSCLVSSSLVLSCRVSLLFACCVFLLTCSSCSCCRSCAFST